MDGAGYFDVGEDVLSGTATKSSPPFRRWGSASAAPCKDGPGQQELDLLHAGGIRVADQIITTRQVIRSVAQRRGLRATFMAKPFPDAPGSGMHLFQRVMSFPEGGDLLTDPDAPTGMSALARHVIAGQLARPGHERGALHRRQLVQAPRRRPPRTASRDVGAGRKPP